MGSDASMRDDLRPMERLPRAIQAEGWDLIGAGDVRPMP